MSNVNCQNCKQEFVIATEDFEFYNKIKVPPPTFCPDCRLQRRLTFRNERSLYKDECDLCHKSMLSGYSPDKPFKVYCRECYNSDGWDPMSFGRDFDPAKPFFAQFQELMKSVPRVGTIVIGTAENAEYANYIRDVKNVYLAYSVWLSENVFYSRAIDRSKEIVDSTNIQDSEKCYENIDCNKNYNCSFMIQSRNCLESSFLFDCSNCEYCFMSSGLRSKKYVFRNKQMSQSEYEKAVLAVDKGSNKVLDSLKKEFTKLCLQSLHQFAAVSKVTNSSGNNISNCKNALNVFDAYDIEGVKYGLRLAGSRDSQDVNNMVNGDLVYEQILGADHHNSQFITNCVVLADCQYCDSSFNSNNLFGCAGLKKKEYCILNKQYSKEEYGVLREKIVAQMDKKPFVDAKGRVYKFGELFPLELSTFAYNEALGYEYFPMTKDQALALGFPWRDKDPYPHKITVQSSDLPDNIKDSSDEVLKEVIGCVSCGRAYKIIKTELDYLKSFNISLPRKCPDCRYHDRFSLRGPIKLWPRECMCEGRSGKSGGVCDYKNVAEHFHGTSKCPNKFETPYAPERPETVYCEQCYQSEVV